MMKHYYLSFIALNILFILGANFFLNSKIAQQIQSDQELISITFGLGIKTQHTLAKAFFERHINTPEVQKIMFQANQENDIDTSTTLRRQLYRLLNESYEYRKENHGLKQLHFHLKNNYSFLRFHRPARYGDDLTGVRKTVEYVNKHLRPVSAFEEGRIFNGYRFVFPIFYQNKHVGSVESSISASIILDHFASQLKAPSEFILRKSLIKQKVFSKELKNYEYTEISSNYYREKSEEIPKSELILELLNVSNLSKNTREKLMEQGAFFSTHSWYNNQFYITSFSPIYNTLAKTHSGYFIVTRKHTEFIFTLAFLITITILFSLISAAILYFIYKYLHAASQLSSRNQILDEVQKTAKIATWEHNQITKQHFWSNQMYELLHLDPKVEPSLDLHYRTVHPLDVEQTQKAFREGIKSRQDFSIKHRVFRPDGKEQWVVENCHLKINDKTHKVEWVLGITQDITEFEKLNQKLNTFINAQNDLTFLSNGETITYANQAFLTFFNEPSTERFVEKYTCVCNLFVHKEGFFWKDETVKHSREWVSKILELPSEKRIVLLYDALGSPHAFSVSISKYDETNYIIAFNDITATISEKQLLEDQVQHDTLTGAYTRAYLEQYLIKVDHKISLNEQYYILVFDIDFFKRVNDQFGHVEGDVVLKELVNVVKASIRKDDKLVRWGGEEFVLIGETQNILENEIMANNLRQTIEKHRFSGDVQHITCSFGISNLKKNISFDEAFKRADKALYQAKESGRNQVMSDFV